MGTPFTLCATGDFLNSVIQCTGPRPFNVEACMLHARKLNRTPFTTSFLSARDAPDTVACHCTVYESSFLPPTFLSLTPPQQPKKKNQAPAATVREGRWIEKTGFMNLAVTVTRWSAAKGGHAHRNKWMCCLRLPAAR